MTHDPHNAHGWTEAGRRRRPSPARPGPWVGTLALPGRSKPAVHGAVGSGQARSFSEQAPWPMMRPVEKDQARPPIR